MSARYWCERAWLGPGQTAERVLVDVQDAHVASVRVGSDPPPDAVRLPGLTLPGFANVHSHAFHRALRGRTQTERGTFWTWREQMYGVAGRLTPETYYELARATYAEMLAAGITAVGEFHYLHHRPDGRAYDNPNAMGEALIAAALDTGIRITLLDTCYLSAGFGAPPTGVQVRYSDGDVDAWARRVAALATPDDRVVLGAAIHSVRAVPAEQMPDVAQALPGAPLHVHLSEQTAENEACQQAYGCTPTELLARQGVIDDRTTAVHATHLTDADVGLLGQARAFAGFCPTTERDLADGVGPSRPLTDAGARLTLGSDSHAVIDPFEEMRAVELDERLVTRARGHWQAAELLTAATRTGQVSLGFADSGRIAPHAWADLVTVDLDSQRTAGAGDDEEALVFAASAADVTHVVTGGRVVERDSGRLGRDLRAAITKVVQG